MTAGCSEELSRMKQVTSRKIKMLTLYSFGRMWMLGSRLTFSAKRKLQFFGPGCSSESLSSGEAIEK